MSISVIEVDRPLAQSALLTEETISFYLLGGRTISAPLAWYPRLANGTPEERGNWRLIARGEGIHWPDLDLDEELSVTNSLSGKPSGESQQSFRKWLEERNKDRAD